MPDSVTEAIFEAIKTDRNDILKALLENIGGDPHLNSNESHADLSTSKAVLNSVSIEDGTFLHLATKLKYPDIARTLLAAGADPGIQNINGETPVEIAGRFEMQNVYTDELFRATGQSDIGRICQLLAAGLSIDCIDSRESQNSLLHWAVSFATNDTLQALLDRGANPNMCNSEGLSPLHEAVIGKNEDAVRTLISHGADPNLKIIKGKYQGKSAHNLADNLPHIGGILRSTISRRGTRGSLGNLPNGKNASLDSLHSLEQDSYNPVDPENIMLRVSDPSVTKPVKPLVTNCKFHLLWPVPQHMTELKGAPFHPPTCLHMTVLQGSVSSHCILDVWEQRRADFEKLGHEVKVGDIEHVSGHKSDSCIVCSINPDLLQYQNSYKLTITSRQIQIVAHDLPGLYYSICTLLQLVQLFSSEGITNVNILDYPSYKYRGVLFDVSPLVRSPNIETLFTTVKILSSVKVNQLHIYTKFSGKMDWSLHYTHSDLIALDRHCRDLYIDIIPVVDVTPDIGFNDLQQLWNPIQKFLLSFSKSRFVHIGPHLCNIVFGSCCEEDIDLVFEGLWKFLPIPHDVTLFLCCNSFHFDRQIVNKMPSNVILLEYGFQADYDFQDSVSVILEGGCSLTFCPGTAAWNSFAGYPEAAICNVDKAVQTCSAVKGLGIVVAHWSSGNHLVHLPFIWPGYFAGAGLGWNSSSMNREYLLTVLPDLLSLYIYEDLENVIGNVIYEMGRVETYLQQAVNKQKFDDVSKIPNGDGSLLFTLFMDPDSINLEHLSLEVFNKAIAQLKRCQNDLCRSKMTCKQAEIIKAELQLTIDFMILSARIGRSLVHIGQNPLSNMGYSVINLGVSNLPPTVKTDVANKLLDLIGEVQTVWLSRYLPPGLQTTLLSLNQIIHCFVPETPSTDP